MSWRIGVSIGESIVEITAIRGEEKRSHCWFLPRRDLSAALQQFLSDLPDIAGSVMNVTTHLGDWLLRRRLGTPIALLVTSGFEHWPSLRQPVLEGEFRVGVHRTPPFLNTEFIFGVSERIRADGAIETKLDMAELEFLVSKLELVGIKQVAVGFLNSQQNSSHEKMAGEFLKSKGLDVFLSSELSTTSNEVARWWRAFLNAYLASSFQDFQKELTLISEKFAVDIRILDSQGLHGPSMVHGFLDTLMGEAKALQHWSQINNVGSLLYLGLERFWILRADQHRDVWMTDLGPVALSHPMIHRMQLQPTSPIVEGLFHTASFGDRELHFDPGPILAGRGHRLMALDAWAFTSQDMQLAMPFVTDESMNRVQNALSTYGKNHSLDFTDIAQELFKLGQALLTEEIARLGWPGPLYVSGPLMPLMTGTQVEFKTAPVNLSSLALAEIPRESFK